MAKKIVIPGRLHAGTTEQIVTGANEVLDDKRNKKQSEVNDELFENIKKTTNTIDNIADEEDLTLVSYLTPDNYKLKIKDRNDNDGMGYVILRKNKDISSQIINPNTIYEIRYDFNLNSEEITIPDNCTLDFQGGSFSNGTINGNGTKIKAGLEKIFDTNVELSGTWNVVEAYPEWFEGNDNIKIQKAIDTFNYVILPNNYNISDTIYLRGNKSILIKNKIVCSSNTLFVVTGSYNTIVGGTNTVLRGDNSDICIKITDTVDSSTHVYSFYNKIKNITIQRFNIGVQIYNEEISSASYFNSIKDCVIISCLCGLELKGLADGNFINNITFYECGVANDANFSNRDKSVIKLSSTGENKFPLENVFDKIFITNSYDIVCLYIENGAQFNHFTNVQFEPGGEYSVGIYCENESLVKDNVFHLINLTNQGNRNFPKYSNTLLYTTLLSSKSLRSVEYTNPLEVINCYEQTNINGSYAEDAWLPLLNINYLGNGTSFHISLKLYVESISLNKQDYQSLETLVYKNNDNIIVNVNNDRFKIENSIVYFKTQPLLNGGTPLRIKFVLKLGSYRGIHNKEYNDVSVNDMWTQIS